MKWKYYIPHIWESERTTWEDVYLLPDYPGYDGNSIWLTVDAILGLLANKDLDDEEKATLSERCQQMGERQYVIDEADMTVKAEDFSKEELLGWVRVWLEESGFEVKELVEGTLEDFEDSNEHVKAVAHSMRLYSELQAEREV